MIKAAVVGVGQMGAHHARILASLFDVELIGVHDINFEIGEKVAKRFNTTHFSSFQDLLSKGIEALIVAVPTELHLDVGKKAIESGVDRLLIEKPLARSVEEGQMLVDLARENNVHLMVGHIVRFDPVIQRLGSILEERGDDPIFNASTRRWGFFPERIRDGVTLDLAIHDIDIICDLFREQPSHVTASIRSYLGKRSDDSAIIILDFQNAHALISVNWLISKKIRTMSLVTSNYFFELDFMRKSLEMTVRSDEIISTEGYVDFLRTRVGESKIFAIPDEEPLKNEIIHFLHDPEPIVPGHDGLKAIKIIESAKISSEKGVKIPLDFSF